MTIAKLNPNPNTPRRSSRIPNLKTKSYKNNPTPSDQLRRRTMIANIFVCVFDAPPPSEWGEKGKHDGLVSAISKALNIKQGSSATVRRVMEQTYKALTGIVDLDLYRKSRQKAPIKYKIEPKSKYEIMVC